MSWKKIVRNPYVWAFLFGIICLHWVREYSKMRLSAPPPWVIVGPWTLTDFYAVPQHLSQTHGCPKRSPKALFKFAR